MSVAGRIRNITDKQLTAGVIIAVILPAVIYYLPWLSGSRAFYQSDTSYFFEPMCRFLSETYRAGRLPLWNPYIWCGMSQVAVLSPSAFYPFNLPFIALSFSPALALYMIVHELIAFGGMYLLCRVLGLSKLASLCAAVVAAFNGYMISIVSNFTLMATGAWIPLATAAIVSAGSDFSRRNMSWLALGTVSIAMMILAGRPDIFAPAMALLTIFAAVSCLMKLRGSERGAAVKQLLWRWGILALGIAIAAPVLAPAMEWWRLSYRAYGITPKAVLIWSTNWYDWLCTTFIQPLGDLTDYGARVRELVASRSGSLQYVPSCYVGAVPMTTAAIALFARGWPWRWWFFGAGLLMALMASGSNTPLAPFMVTHVPFLDLFRFPVKLMIIPIYCIAVLTAVGIDAVLEKRARLYAVAGVTAIWLSLAAAGAYLRFAPDVLPAVLSIPVPSDFTPLFERLMDFQEKIGRSVMSGAMVALSICILCIMHGLGKIPRNIFAFVITFTIVSSIALAAWMYPPRSTRGDFYDMPNPVAADLHPRLFTTKGIFVQRAYPLYSESSFIPRGDKLPTVDENVYRQARLMLFANQASDFKIPVPIGYEAAGEGRITELTYNIEQMMWRLHNPGATDRNIADSDILLARFCNISGAAFVSIPILLNNPTRTVFWLDGKWFERVAVDNNSNYAIYHLKQSHSRAYFARDIIWTKSWDPFYTWMQDTHDPSFEKVYVRGEFVPAPDAVAANPSDTDEQAVIETDQTEYVKIQTKTNGKRLLVLTDTWYPRWNAYVDGKPVYTYKANLFFRGVPVPAGAHTVEFKYEPINLWVAFVLAAAAAAGTFLLWFKAARTAPAETIAAGNG